MLSLPQFSDHPHEELMTNSVLKRAACHLQVPAPASTEETKGGLGGTQLAPSSSSGSELKVHPHPRVCVPGGLS